MEKSNTEKFLDEVEDALEKYGFSAMIEVWGGREDGGQFLLVRHADNTITLRNNFDELRQNKWTKTHVANPELPKIPS